MQIADLFFVLSAAAPAPGRTRPRAKSDRNRAGFLIIFSAPNGARVVCFLSRAPIGFRAGQKK